MFKFKKVITVIGIIYLITGFSYATWWSITYTERSQKVITAFPNTLGMFLFNTVTTPAVYILDTIKYKLAVYKCTVIYDKYSKDEVTLLYELKKANCYSAGVSYSESKLNHLIFQTKKGSLDIFIDKVIPVMQKMSDQSYKIYEDSLKSYFVGYYSGVDLKNKIDFTLKGDGTNPGYGCKLIENQTKIGTLNLQQVECYYNPLGTTYSGDYITGVSDVLHTNCVYWVDDLQTEALYFWGSAEIGHNTCEFLSREVEVLYKK